MARNQLIQYRRDTSANWASVDPVIAEGEPAYDKTNEILKIGNGVSKFSELKSVNDPTNIIVGVEWDRNSSSPTLRRINEDGNTINLTLSDFDFHRIYSQIKRVEVNSSGNVIAVGTNGRGDGLTLTNNYIMVRYPRVYYKHYRVDANGVTDDTGRYERILISPYAAAGFSLHPAFYARGNTLSPREYIYVGAYTGDISSSKLLSRSGVASTVSQTMDTFETAAKANGTDKFGILDIHTLSLLRMLFLVEYASFNSQAALGNGYVASTNTVALNTGTTNASLSSNGTYGTTANQTTGMCWRGIENFWGNLWQFIIGFNGYTDKYRIIKPDGSGTYAATLASGSYNEHTSPVPIWYSNAQGGTQAGTVENGYVCGYTSDFLFTTYTKGLFIPATLSGSDSTYITDYFYSVSPTNQPTIFLHGGPWASALRAGAFYSHVYHAVGDVYSNVGARLCLYT